MTEAFPAELGPMRLDRAVAALFAALPTRGSARKACERGEVLLDGLPAESSRWLRGGERIELLPDGRAAAFGPRLDLEIVYLDPWMAVVHKPAGLPTSGPSGRTMEQALVGVLGRSDLPDALPTGRAVHRLDAPTSGLVVVARTRGAHAALGRAFEQREVEKRYRAIVVGELVGEGRVDTPIDGREAATRWASVEVTPALRTGAVTTLDVWPRTGRTHQIRRHLASLGHPVLGDPTYTSGPALRSKGLFLCAGAIALPHPATGERVELALPEPAKFASLRAREERRHARFRGAA